MKKILSILLAAAMLISAVACSNKKEEENEGVPTLRWLVPGDKQPDMESVTAEINKITEKKIGAKLDIQFIDTGSFAERMKMNMAAGEPYDLCFTGYVNNYIQAVTNGGLLDITDMVEARPKLKEAIPEYAWEAATVDGKIWAVPNLQIMATSIGIVIDKSIADKYDFDWSKVTHIRDIEPFLEMVKVGEPDKIPYRTGYGLTFFTNPKWETLDGGYAIARDGSSSEIVILRETDEFKEGQKTVRRWYEKGYIRKDALSVGDDTTDYKAGKYVITPSTLKPGVEQTIEAELGKDVIIVELTEPYLTKSSALATMIGVGANSKNAEKAVDFIELVNTDKELYHLICHGIKDKHYTLNEEGKVKYIDNSGYSPKADWKFGNQFNALLLEGMDDNVWVETANRNLEAVKSPLLEFQFNNEPVKSEISQYSTIGDEFEAVNNGADAPENYMDEWVRKCEAAGQKKIGEELQNQINEFWKTKG